MAGDLLLESEDPQMASKSASLTNKASLLYENAGVRTAIVILRAVRRYQ
jgi:hypothetical protein